MVTIYDKFRQIALQSQNDCAINFLGREFTYEYMLKNVDRLAYGLSEQGVKKDTVVTVFLPNCVESVFLLYALSKLGAISSILHPETPKNSVEQCMQKTKSEVIFMLDTSFCEYKSILADKLAVLCSIYDYLPKVKGIGYMFANRDSYRSVRFSKKVLHFSWLLRGDGEVEQNTDAEKPSVYIQSGGTTDYPKIVQLSDSAQVNLAMRGKGILQQTDVAGKGMLAVLPIFHAFGLCMGVHTILLNGGVCVLFPRFMVREIIKQIRRGKVHYMTGVPTIYQMLLREKGFKGKGIAQIQFAFCGGDKLSDSIKADFDSIMKKYNSDSVLHQGYGLTETLSVCSVNNKLGSKDGSIGKPLENIKIRAMDNENFLGAGEIGELAVCSDTLMLGYLNDDEATIQAKVVVDGETWVRTGDIGYVDCDGFVWFTERKKRVIKVNSVSIFPTEIEQIVAKHPSVNKACAVGINADTAGHTVVLHIEKNKDDSVDDEKIREEIIQYLSENLMRYALPTHIIIHEKLPLTNIGKVDFKKLEQYQIQ